MLLTIAKEKVVSSESMSGFLKPRFRKPFLLFPFQLMKQGFVKQRKDEVAQTISVKEFVCRFSHFLKITSQPLLNLQFKFLFLCSIVHGNQQERSTT